MHLEMHLRIPAKLFGVCPDLVSPSTSSSTSHDTSSTAETVCWDIFLLVCCCAGNKLGFDSKHQSSNFSLPALVQQEHCAAVGPVLRAVPPASYTKDLWSCKQVRNESPLPVLTGTVMLFSYFVFLTTIPDILAVHQQKLC